MGVVSCQKTKITDTLRVSIFSTNYIKINIIMKIAICFACVVAMATAESWMAAPYTLVKRAAEPQTIIPTQDSSLATEHLMLVLLELLLELLDSTSPTSSSTPAGTGTGTTTEDKQITESLVETPETSFLALLGVLLLLPLQMLLLEILVEDKRLLSILLLD